MNDEKDRVDVYLETLKRLEPGIATVDMIYRDAALASIAISLRRIADALAGVEDIGDAILEVMQKDR